MNNSSIYTMNDPNDVERRNKYSIINRSVYTESNVNFDSHLFQTIEERIKKATERKEEYDRLKEKQVSFKKELSRLKKEEISELKMI